MGENTKLFFSTSPKTKERSPDLFARIYAVLYELPLVLTETYLENTSLKTIAEWNSAEKDTFYKTTLAAITASDMCIFEATQPSLTLAHFIRFSLDQDKPTAILHEERAQPFLLENAGEVEPMLFAYGKFDLERTLRLAIQEAQELPTAIRFNCLISADLNRYISQTAKTKHLSKSEFFRKLVREHRQKSA